MSRAPVHLYRWAPQDWLTSRVRARAIRTGDPHLAAIYRDIIDVLRMAGGPIAADPLELEDLLHWPVEEIERVVGILLEMGNRTTTRGGLYRTDDGRLSCRRVEDDIAADLEFRGKKAEAGRIGGERSATSRRDRLGSAQPARSSASEDRSNTSAAPKHCFDVVEAGSKLPLPLPLPAPLPPPQPLPLPAASAAADPAGRDADVYLHALETEWPVSPLPLRLGAVKAINERLDDLPPIDTFRTNVQQWAQTSQWQRGYLPTNPGRWIRDGGADNPPPSAKGERREPSIDDARRAVESDIASNYRNRLLDEDRRDVLIERARAATTRDDLDELRGDIETIIAVATEGQRQEAMG